MIFKSQISVDIQESKWPHKKNLEYCYIQVLVHCIHLRKIERMDIVML